ncbi:MAG: starch synthase [Granulosicoccus sp.]|jgi:starch synthase
MPSPKHICMLAAENDVIPGGKVGGIGDVVRDIPKALSKLGVRVSVVIPAYALFHQLPGSIFVGTVTTEFRGRTERIELYELFANRDDGVQYYVIHHPLFGAGGPGKVYCDDDSNQPFATDANKFALFSVASLSIIRSGLLDTIDVLHLHDWHSALAAALLKFDPAFQSLRSVHCVYSIHNLALQGIRPFSESTSSLEAWFPHLHYNKTQLSDPRWTHCVNPMATAIRLADKVHTVSPTYAEEIIRPNDASKGFHGGEGLDKDLQFRAEQGRLLGIINGIDYSASEYSSSKNSSQRNTKSWKNFLSQASDEMLRIIGNQNILKNSDYLVHQRLARWQLQPMPAHVITSVGRLTDQKMALLLQPMDDGNIPLESLLELLKNRGLLLVLGTGDTDLEITCKKLAANHPHFLFFNQYSQHLSDLLFSNGDLFLMPSSFEPCGISQMLAMRAGQPCLAHEVGGLKDTIKDNETGYLFSGDSLSNQSTAMIERFKKVLLQREKQPAGYRKISVSASKERFHWQNSAEQYMTELYS